MSPMIALLSERRAISAVKAELQGQGTRLVDVEYRVLVATARLWLKDHPGMYDATMEWVLGSPELRKLWDREQRQRQRQSVQRTTNNLTVSA